MEATRSWMWPWLCAAVMAVGALVRAAEGPEPATFSLKPVVCKPGDDTGSVGHASTYVRLDRNGQAELPFATASGKLRFKVTGGKIIMDRNDDGRFNAADGEGAAGDQVSEVPVKLAGKDFQYPLSIRTGGNGPEEKPRYAVISGLAHLEAQVGETKVCLIDSNLSGRFGDAHDPEGEQEGDLLQIGSEDKQQPITRYIELDGKIQELKILGECEAIALRLHAGPTAALKVEAREGWKVETRLSHKGGAFVVDAEVGAKCMLLPGAYEIEWVTASSGSRKDDDGEARAEIQLYGGGSKGAPVQIKEGENALSFGPPFKLEFAAARSTEDASDIEITDVALAGAGGDRYRAYNHGSGGGNALNCYIRSGARSEKVSTLGYG
jgi:hypothetical protein